MPKVSVVKGTTSYLARIFIQDSSSTTGAGLTGLVFNSSGLVCYRARDDDGNAGATAISLATATLGTWASGGFKEKDATNQPGVYEFGVPNAALATGSKSVLIMFKGATNMAQLPLEIELTGMDNQDGVRGGMTALPNAAANAAGGLPISAAGALDLDEMNVDIEAIQVQTDKLAFTVTNQVDANVIDWKGAAAPAMTGDAFARLGAPVGASISADIAEIEGETDAIIATLGSPAGASVSVDIAAVKTETAEIDAIVDLLPDAGALSSLATAANLAEANDDLDELITTIGAAGVGLTAVGITSNIKKNQALAKFAFLMTDSTTHAPATGLTVTCTRSIDGGAFGAGTLANVTEIGAGIYTVDFGAGDLNGKVIVLQATAAASDTTLERIVTQA